MGEFACCPYHSGASAATGRSSSTCDAHCNHRYTSRESGFTLLEVLITLVLLAIVAVTVFGSLKQVFEARSRLRPYLDQSEQTALAGSWFRQSVQTLIPDYQDAKDRFSATGTAFSGLTASPLAGPAGTPTPFRWALRYDPASDLTTLEYGESVKKAMRIATWAGQRGAFTYFGTDQQWHSAWPPDRADQQAGSADLPQFPLLIRLGGIEPEVFPTLIAAPRGSPIPRQLSQPLFGGS
jgi:prepilin-type N-terminal cleavage/methylation domain-containing protein